MAKNTHRTAAQQIAARRRREDQLRQHREQELANEMLRKADALHEMLTQSGILRGKSRLQ